MKKILRPALLALCVLALLLGGLYVGRRVYRHLKLQPPEHPLPVLMYHNVVEDGEECNEMTVTVSRLREDFQWLRDHGYTPILPRELLRGELPERPVLITFDDGYESNYNLLFPLLQEFRFKAVISSIVWMCDLWSWKFCNWYALREMQASGLVEIGSHTYALHNLDNDGMFKPKGQPNGIQRLRGESDEAFQVRVLEDLQKSYDRLTEELGESPVFFAYPFGAEEPDAQELIDRLFPVSVLTNEGYGNLDKAPVRMPRFTVSMRTPVSAVLKP